jgi:phenylalanyl-tRNA synthetase beta chain
LLTDLGLEVEVVEKYQSIGGLEGIVVGHVLTVFLILMPTEKITTVDLGDGVPVQIVCGAANVDAGQKSTCSKRPYYMTQQGCFYHKKGKIRGQESHGMICAEDELGLELAMTVS